MLIVEIEFNDGNKVTYAFNSEYSVTVQNSCLQLYNADTEISEYYPLMNIRKITKIRGEKIV